ELWRPAALARPHYCVHSPSRYRQHMWQHRPDRVDIGTYLCLRWPLFSPLPFRPRHPPVPSPTPLSAPALQLTLSWFSPRRSLSYLLLLVTALNAGVASQNVLNRGRRLRLFGAARSDIDGCTLGPLGARGGPILRGGGFFRHRCLLGGRCRGRALRG